MKTTAEAVNSTSMTFPIYTLAFRRMDGALSAYWSIDFFRFDEARVVRNLVAHRNGIPLIAFTADGKWLAPVGADGGIRCWH
jgi:WD40 repeat protein